MSRSRRGALGLLLAVVLLIWAPAAAFAEAAKSVQFKSQNGREVQFLVYLDPAVTVTDASTVASQVMVSAQEVPSTAAFVVDRNLAKEAILVLDVSGSMKGDRLKQAKKAAADYVASLPPDVKVGLVSFNDTIDIGVRPTTDRAAVLAAIDSVSAGKKTALFDGILAGLDLSDSPKGARLVVLSDGGDTASSATIDDVRLQLQSSDTPIDIVALTPNEAHAVILAGLASTSGGQYLLATDAGGLKKAFDEASGSFGQKVNVTATVPPEVNASGKFAVVGVTVDNTVFTGTASFPRTSELEGSTPDAPVVTPSQEAAPLAMAPDGGNPAPWLYGILAALIVIVLALTMAYYRRQQEAFLRTQQVLWYSNALTEGAAPVRPGFQQQGFVKGIDRWMASRDGYSKREAKLDSAGLTMSPGSWLVMRVAITTIVVLVLAIVFGSLLIGTIVGILLGWLGTRWYVNSREAKKQKSFENELPDFLLLIASALRSGLSFNQALDSTAADGQGEVSRQIRRALREVQMGSGLEPALTRVADRMDSDDLRWTVTALTIQREVGGNLSNILDTAAQTVQSRAELRREVRTLSAEGKLSGWVLAGLPVGVFLYMLLVNRTYVSFFWTNTIGYICLGVMLVMFAIGFFWMQRLVKIKV